MTAAPLRASGLCLRYGRTWALRDCDLTLPEGRVSALVGPNGAGKTTLLHLAAGFLRPAAGRIEVFGLAPWPQTPDVVARIGFVAQDHPLYRSFTVDETLTMGRRLNPSWDDAIARGHLERLRIPFDRRVRALSGGQRAQVALALALGKRPELLLLDEPLASLDPLARRHFLGMLMEAATESGATILLSSHIVADLERVCDHLLILNAGRVQLAADIAEVVRSHKRLVGPRRDARRIAGVARAVEVTQTERQTTLVARVDGPVLDPSWDVYDLTLEDVVLAYLGAEEEELEARHAVEVVA
jgi:ABC-2 type transport system ATP-binding protein